MPTLVPNRAPSRLRKWRLQHGYTLDDVAAIAGINPSTLSRIERGERHVAATEWIDLARILGVPVRTIYDPHE